MDPLWFGILGNEGSVLSVAHKAAIQVSFPLLKKSYQFGHVLFLGQITGKAGDYLIAMGSKSLSAEKTFFYW